MKQILLVLALLVAYVFPVNPDDARTGLRGALHAEAMAMLTGETARQDAADPELLRAAILRDAEEVLEACGIGLQDWGGDGI